MISSLGEIVLSLAELETFPGGVGGGGGWLGVGGCLAGSSGTKANLAQLGLELGLSFAIMKIKRETQF